jgi:septal ring factor EnvC (AmiA/AmiB activator)
MTGIEKHWLEVETEHLNQVRKQVEALERELRPKQQALESLKSMLPEYQFQVAQQLGGLYQNAGGWPEYLVGRHWGGVKWN